MNHPWKDLIEQIRERDWTQKQFSHLAWKKVSEVNELIKWKRNITIQWDLLLSNILGTPEKYWIHKQIDHDYIIAKTNFTTNNSLLTKKEETEKIDLWLETTKNLKNISSIIEDKGITLDQNKNTYIDIDKDTTSIENIFINF